MFLEEYIQEFLIYCSSIKSFSSHTVKGYKNDLQKFISLLEEQRRGSSADILPDSITLTNLRSCVSSLSKEKKAASSINRFISSVRSFFAYAHRMQYCSINPALEFKTVKMPKRIPRYMTPSEVAALCRQPGEKEILWAGRDKAIFEVLYSSGCRVSELSSLNLEDLGADISSAMITGKGKKDRRIFFSAEAVTALKVYLPLRAARIHADKPVKALFINQAGTRLSPRGISFIVSRYSSIEGTHKPVSPHAFRHTFATSLLSNGADIRIVQELLGHASISTTQRYTHVTTDQLIETYNKSHPHGGK